MSIFTHRNVSLFDGFSFKSYTTNFWPGMHMLAFFVFADLCAHRLFSKRCHMKDFSIFDWAVLVLIRLLSVEFRPWPSRLDNLYNTPLVIHQLLETETISCTKLQICLNLLLWMLIGLPLILEHAPSGQVRNCRLLHLCIGLFFKIPKAAALSKKRRRRKKHVFYGHEHRVGQKAPEQQWWITGRLSCYYFLIAW